MRLCQTPLMKHNPDRARLLARLVVFVVVVTCEEP
jgi:hypothetical protein